MKSYRIPLILFVLLTLISIVAAQDEIPLAEIVNDEGGTVSIVGELDYTNLLFASGVAEPLIILEDQAGFVKRDLDFLFPQESQVLGQFTGDIFSPPVSYSITLPLEPKATLVDVDNDDEQDTGVMVYAIAYWTNVFGDPYLEARDQGGGGWSSDYASTIIDPATLEVEGGKYLVYAPDDQQGFPAGFGDDGLLFTEDDPLVRLPQGYTVVDLNSDPFTFDRSREARIDTIESTQSAAADFSDLSYTEAFDAMIEKLRREYAFSEYKNIDWDAKIAEFRPRFEEAEAEDDSDAYLFALRDFIWSIPDGHLGMSAASDALDNEFYTNIGGGLGLSLVELNDGRVLVNFVLDGGPGQEAGIELGAEIREINGTPISKVVSETVPFSSPFSADHDRRLQQLRYAMRFPLETEVELTYQNPGDDQPTSATLTTAEEFDSFSFSSYNKGLTFFEPPITYEILQDSGYGYVKIYSFFENEVLTVQLFEHFLNLVNQLGIPGIIIDMRQNGGGSGLLADGLAGYFFDEPVITGYTGFYDEDTGDFYTNLDAPDEIFPAPEAKRYTGEVVVLVGPACVSACEFFSYNLTFNDRAAIIGQYPTGGLGGSITDFLMPEGAQVRYTLGRAVDPDGNIHIEGKGVIPTVIVPVDEETAFSGGDPVLDAAIAYLDEQMRE